MMNRITREGKQYQHIYGDKWLDLVPEILTSEILADIWNGWPQEMPPKSGYHYVRYRCGQKHMLYYDTETESWYDNRDKHMVLTQYVVKWKGYDIKTLEYYNIVFKFGDGFYTHGEIDWTSATPKII